MTIKLYVIEEHDQLLHIWREQDVQNLRIVHFDFHCDMRGMLVDREKQHAYRIFDLLAMLEIDDDLDIGNFLMHAVMEGRVSGVRWVHRTPGGRNYDVGTVKYTTDLTVQPTWFWQKLWRRQGVPLAYEVLAPEQWQGLAEGEFLDIDWDYFVGLDYPPEVIADAVEEFFALNFHHRPIGISVYFSPNFSHPDRSLFETFITRLAEKFGATVVRVPLPPRYGIRRLLPIGRLPQSIQNIANRGYRKIVRVYENTYDRVTRSLHRRGVH